MHRLALLMLAAGVAATMAASATAASNERVTYTAEPVGTLNLLCPFAVQWQATATIADILHFNGDGVPVAEDVHVAEIDVLSANGKSITSEPYSANIHFTFDENGDPATIEGSGVVAKFRLPDGSLWMAAGRVDILPWLAAGEPWLSHPDTGKSGDPATLCAALAP